MFLYGWCYLHIANSFGLAITIGEAGVDGTLLFLSVYIFDAKHIRLQNIFNYERRKANRFTLVTTKYDKEACRLQPLRGGKK